MKFLVLSALIVISFFFLTSCRTAVPEEVYEDGSYWIDNYFKQERVITPQPGSEIVEAMIDGVWQEYELRELPPAFMEWSIAKRLDSFERFRDNRGPELSGPHSGIVATYGIKRGDTQFKLNNAVKGVGFLPKFDKIKEVIELLESTKDAGFHEKLDVLQGIYDRADELFAKHIQTSLELYPTPEYETQTFLNQMTYPVSTIVFLDIPSFKLKTITRLLHPEDPELTPYEKLIVRYVNDIYSYFHGGRGKDYITTVYYVVEVYDNSPGRPDARGTRIE
jgi:hypothetical protein